MQQMLIEKEREIEHSMYIENRAIQPKTVGKGRKKKKEKRAIKMLQKSVKDNRGQ